MAQPSLDNRLNGPFSTFEPAKSKELERDGWMGYGVEALPSSTVGDSAAETRPT